MCVPTPCRTRRARVASRGGRECRPGQGFPGDAWPGLAEVSQPRPRPGAGVPDPGHRRGGQGLPDLCAQGEPVPEQRLVRGTHGAGPTHLGGGQGHRRPGRRRSGQGTEFGGGGACGAPLQLNGCTEGLAWQSEEGGPGSVLGERPELGSVVHGDAVSRTSFPSAHDKRLCRSTQMCTGCSARPCTTRGARWRR